MITGVRRRLACDVVKNPEWFDATFYNVDEDEMRKLQTHDEVARVALEALILEREPVDDLCFVTGGMFLLVVLPSSEAPAVKPDQTAAKQQLRHPEYSRAFAASAFAVGVGGLDEPIGWAITYTPYLPDGRLRQEFVAASQAAADPSDSALASFARRTDLFSCITLSRNLKNVPERRIQDSWAAEVDKWWPPDDNCSNARPEELPLPQLIGTGCKAGFLRQFSLRTTRAVVATGELKSNNISPVEGIPQAIITASSAVVHLRSLGLDAGDCVVPFFVGNGSLEQHGAVYLLEPCFPCAVLTTPVMDPSSEAGTAAIVAARWAMKCIADKTVELLRSLQRSGHLRQPSASEPVPAALDLSKYLIKSRILRFVGSTLQHSIVHQLRVFARIVGTPAEEYCVCPAAVLMQVPPLVDATRAGWLRENGIVFPALVGFNTGVPLPGDKEAAYRPAVIAALRTAVQALHGAGVVHMDLHPGNIMWKPKHAASSSGSGAATSSSASVELEVELRLVDFDAALFVGQFIPEDASIIVERNGHSGSYHPGLTGADGHLQLEKADPCFDWWHFAMLERDDCPFASACSKGGHSSLVELSSWRKEHREELLARVAELLQDKAGSGPDAPQTKGPMHPPAPSPASATP